MTKKKVSVFSIVLTVIEIAAVVFAALRFIAPDLFSNMRPVCALVVSDSMQPVLTPGTFVTLRPYHEGDELEVGDIVTYLRKDGKTIIHRVKEMTDDYVITKGDNNSISDPKISYSQIRGVVKKVLRVDSEKVQSIVRNFYAKDNTSTRRYVSIGVIALAACLLISSFIPDKKSKAVKESVPDEAQTTETSASGSDDTNLKS